MNSVEKITTTNNIELFKSSPEYADRIEPESKFLAVKPEVFEEFRAIATPIERQPYLSHPDEEFSLRTRKWHTAEGTQYTAALKDRGQMVGGVQERLEVEVPISKEAYDFYAQGDRYPYVSKLRAEPSEGLVIDFFEGFDTPVVEIETKDQALRESYLALYGDALMDVTGDRRYDSEALAHQLHPSPESQPTKESLDAFSERVAKEMVARYVVGNNQVVVGLTGMSGSGKSTVTRMVQNAIAEEFGEEFRPIVVSTDDYHFGKEKLEAMYGAPWTEWDDPRTYNTAELAIDLANLADGIPLIRRHFDFATEEPVFDYEIAPVPFVIVEGLYAGSSDLASVRDLHFELPTPVATSIGRDVRRLVIENRANRVFPTPESRLKYQIETALPLYLSQERPGRNNFSGCARPLGERAAMLVQLRERFTRS